MGFKENLKSELSYQGILVKELANKTGISKRTLDNYLREKSSIPPADVAVKIAKALNVSVEYLINTGIQEDSKINNYSSQIQKLAERLSNFSESDFKMVESLIDFIYDKNTN